MTLVARLSKLVGGVSRKRRCAIVQLEAVHEEIIPSIVFALNGLDIVPDVYINERCRLLRGDIFEELPSLDLNLNYVSMEGMKAWEKLAETLSSSNPECVVISTYQRDGIAAWARTLNLPIIGFVHNAHIFLNAQECVKSFQEHRAQLLTLAPHVCAYLNLRIDHSLIDRTGVLESVYWGSDREQTLEVVSDEVPLVVAVPGGVSFRSRSFEHLTEVLRDGVSWQRPLQFYVLGGGSDRDRLEEIIEKHDLSHMISCAPIGKEGRVLYADYISGLRNSHILHPLAPLAFGPYRDHKITSAIPTAVGFGLPIILDRWTSRVYRAPAIESNVDLASSIETISRLTSRDLIKSGEKMLNYRNEQLQKNQSEIERLILAM